MVETKQPNGDKTMLVKVYFNLHKKCFSVQHKGIVIKHVDSITLKNVKYKVSEAGRQRVLRERKKNVHAFVVGEMVEENVECDTKVSYNPYKYNSFVIAVDGTPLFNSECAFLRVVDKKGEIYAKV
jgi:hypothetical protein